MNPSKLLCPLALALALACTAASAQYIGAGGWYVGLSALHAKATFDSDFPAAVGATASTQTSDQQGTPYRVYVGHQFHRNFAVEGGWIDVGKYDATQDVTAPAAGTLRANVQSSGAFIDAVGIIPIRNFAAFFKLGVVHTKTKTELSSPTGLVGVNGNEERTKSEVSWKSGVGMTYAFTRNWAARLEYERMNNVGDGTTGEFNAKLWSLGATYRF
jgi:OOP family OmpA-OmpF porin